MDAGILQSCVFNVICLTVPYTISKWISILIFLSQKDAEVAALRRKIAIARREAKKLQHKDEMSMTAHGIATTNLERELQKFRYVKTPSFK